MDMTCRRILDAMAWLETKRIPMPWNRALVGFAAGYQPRGGFFKTHVGALRTMGLISYPQPFYLALEHEGRRLAIAFTEELTLNGLHSRALGTLQVKRQRSIMRKLFDAYPKPIKRILLDPRAAVPDMPAIINACARLRACNLALLPDTETIVAHPVMFPKELR